MKYWREVRIPDEDLFTYMDDTVWITNNKTSMEMITKVVEEFFDITRIQINTSKSELIVIRNYKDKINESKVKQEINFAGSIIKPTNQQEAVRYLGIWVTEDRKKKHQQN
ncbi:hypothetical protein Glove_41g123 [Diversispora epigaea]|uniref:Reverse transcriptase domain-containing protein n=1 Tax=Diversispora epigaea TaxID=1348612 RepID=A0A397JIB4_9GLOM|nr:hypothetical protein Glove_41g123 [Diversispora epigaea]